MNVTLRKAGRPRHEKANIDTLTDTLLYPVKSRPKCRQDIVFFMDLRLEWNVP